MATYYRTDDQKEWFMQPSFVRYRHRFRGQRESFKVNSDIHAMRYDLFHLYEKFDRLNTDLDTGLDYLLDLLDSAEVINRLEAIRHRVLRLEQG